MRKTGILFSASVRFRVWMTCFMVTDTSFLKVYTYWQWTAQALK
jgi:hypothetical protein